MHESLDQKIRKLNRYRYLKLAGITFLISIALIITAVTLEETLGDVFQLLMATSFALFFVDFGLFIAFAISINKKEAMVRQMIIDDYWNRRLETWTYEHSDQFFVTSHRDNDQRYLSHHMIPKYATETFYYTLTNQSKQISMHGLRYTHQVSTGKSSSQVIDFSGYMMEINQPISSDLYVRKWDLNEKFKGFFTTQKPEKIEDNTGINGPYDEDLKNLRQQLLNTGFKDVILLEQHGKLTILCEELKLIPKISKDKQESDDTHKKHILKLIHVIDIIDAYLS